MARFTPWEVKSILQRKLSTSHHKIKHSPVLPIKTSSRSTDQAKLAPQCQNLPWKCLQAAFACPKLLNHTRRPMLHFTRLTHTCKDNKLWLCPSLPNFPSKCQLPPQSLPFVFPGARDTPAVPCVLLVAGLSIWFFVLLFFLEQIKQPVSNSQ